MRTVTEAFQAQLDKTGGAKPRRLLEIQSGAELASGHALWDANLISVWHFNGNDDDAKGSNDGTRSGSGDEFDVVNQKLGNAAGRYNGTDDVVGCGNDASLDFGSGSFSVKAWIFVTDYAGRYNGIVTKRGDGGGSAYWQFTIDDGGDADGNFHLVFYLYDGSSVIQTISTDLNKNQWYQVVGVVDKANNELRLYIDAVEYVASATVSNYDNTNNLRIGYEKQNNGYFNGLIDEVAIWDRTISAREIATLYASQKDLFYSDQTVIVGTQTFSAKVLEFGRLVSQIVPGEEVVRVGSMNFRLSNIDPIDDLIVAGVGIRVYDWFVGLATVDKSLIFSGKIFGRPAWDDLEISFSANDIFQKLTKIVGRPLLEAEWEKADPDYYGWTIPILIGAGENLECLPIEAGAASTLREEFTPSDTIIKLTSATSPIAFPSTGTVIIGEVEYVYTGISSNDLTGVANPSITHPEGSIVLEKTNLKYLAGESFSDTPVKSLTELRILPFNSRKIAEAVAIDAAYYSINLTETISDKVYATIVLTQIAAIRQAVSMAITQQPDQPITTQQAQTSPNHGHPPSNVTVTVNLQDTYLVSQSGAQTRANWDVVSYLVDSNFNSKGRWTSLGGASATVRSKRVSLFEENGTPTTLKFKATVTLSGGSGTAKLYINGSLKQTVTLSGGTISSNAHAIPAWGNINQATTYVEIYTTGGSGQYVEIGEVWFEVQYTPANPTTAATINQSLAAVSNRITDAVVGGDTVAATLLGRLICNYTGYKDNTAGHYTGTPTTQPLIEKPPDVIHFLQEKFSNGVIHDYLDIADTFLDARNNLPASYKFGFALTWQVGLDVLCAQLALMAHSRFFTSAALAKFARILDSGTPVMRIDTDDYSHLTEGPEKKLRIKRFGGAIEDVINKVEIRYKHNPVLGSRSNPDAYAGNSESLDSAAQASIDKYGERRRMSGNKPSPWLMWAVRDATMADDLNDKFLDRNQFPKTTTVFPSCSKLAVIEQSDLISLTVSQLRISNSLSEILRIGNIAQVPKNRQPTEVMITVLESSWPVWW